MSLYIERWRARPAWLALSISDRIAYLDRMGAAVRELTRAGVRLLGVSISRTDTPNQVGEQYVAAWAMPKGASQGRQLEEILAAAGWHDYFVPVAKPEPTGRSLFDFVPTPAPIEANGAALKRRKN